MDAAADPVPRIGRFLVELERLEQAQPAGVLLVDRIEATPYGVLLRHPSGAHTTVAATSSTGSIAAALRHGFPGLRVPGDGAELLITSQPDVQRQWALLHYALGAYEHAILEDAQVRVLAVERTGRTATVQVSRGPRGTLETYSLRLDREIDIGLADTLAFAPAYGCVNGSLDQP